MRLLLLYVSGTLLLGGVWACSGTHEQRKAKAAVARPSARQLRPVFDVPAVLGLTIDELVQRLGPVQPLPAGFVDPVTLPLVQRGILTDSSGLFRPAGLNIVATFDIQTREISDLIMLGSDEDELMALGNLQFNAAKYLTLPVFQMHQPSKLMGLRIVVKPQ